MPCLPSQSASLTKFVYKCDQERALESLNQAVISGKLIINRDEETELTQHVIDETLIINDLVEEAARRVGRSASPVGDDDVRIAVPENSAVGESASNGKAERAVQMVEDQIRTVKLALETRIGARIQSSHPMLKWVVLHCADILNEYTVDRSGMSPYEETHGQKAPERRVELGECVFYYVPNKITSQT